MSRRFVGIVLLLAGSLALGMFTGQYFYRLWEYTVPAAVRTEFLGSSAHTSFLLRGLQIGLAFFGWALLAIGVARLFRRGVPAAKESPTP